MTVATDGMVGLARRTREEWQQRRAAELHRVRPWVTERVRRMSRHEKHPVHDFLFEYYSFRPGHLLRWSPGADVWLDGATREELGWAEFLPHDGGLILPATTFPPHRIAYLRWAVSYLEATQTREPSFGCFGMHEWAMVYREPNVRHPAVPLRLSRAETDEVVNSQPPRCTHYDAFRFFTPAAAPLNRYPLTREGTTETDQPGCLHVGMDLYRFAYKLGPFCPMALLADAFVLALTIREADMRASPYDLTKHGYSPIRIETREGREEYVELQRDLHRQAVPVRERLLGVYRELVGGAGVAQEESPGTAVPGLCRNFEIA